jgi:hypothetical protein
LLPSARRARPCWSGAAVGVGFGDVARGAAASIADTVARRLDVLSAEAVLVVECAAVLGRRFDWRLLPAVSALDEVRVQRGLPDATAVQLLSVDDDGIWFRHALRHRGAPGLAALAERGVRALQSAGTGARW